MQNAKIDIITVCFSKGFVLLSRHGGRSDWSVLVLFLNILLSSSFCSYLL